MSTHRPPLPDHGETTLCTTAFHHLSAGVAVADCEGRLLLTNRAFRDLSGRSGGTPGELLADLVHPDDRPALATMFRQTVRTGGGENRTAPRVADGEVRLVRSDGSARWVALGLSASENEGEPVVVIHAEDVHHQRQAEAELHHSATHDQLTGLANRRGLGLFLADEEGRLRNDTTLILLDLDRFKVANDSFGHLTGDRFLRIVAERILAVAADLGVDAGSLLCARMGGDEFVLALSPPPTPEAGLAAAHRLRDALHAPVNDGSHEAVLGASIGISHGPARRATLSDLLAEADLAMYAAKAGGGAGVRVFDTAMGDAVRRRQWLEGELHRGLDQGILTIHVQRVHVLSDRRPVGYEAFARFHPPSNGIIPPSEFIPLAEETGGISRLGDQIREQALDFLAGVDPGGDSFMSINVSPQELRQPSYPERVARELEQRHLTPDRLVIEIVDTVHMTNEPQIAMAVRDLRELGVTLALDDLGTGSASLGSLRRTPFDIMKVDRRLISTVDTVPRDRAIVEAFVALADRLGVKVIAEGVERESQLEVLVAMGCHLGQGWLFGRPRPPADLLGTP